MRSLSVFSLVFLFFSTLISAETHTWYFQTGWVNANPDGVLERPMIGFNGSWPLPTLRVKKGDTVNLYLINGFDDRNTSLHFHGLFQHGTNQMDGPEMVTQCPIPPGETFLYNFTVDDQVGSYWYHSHTSGQYGDGMRGVFIIDDDDFPYDYDEEVILTLGEHYHDFSDDLHKDFMSRFNPTGAEPIPSNILFNETRNNTWKVEPGKTYFVRIINIGRFVSQYVWMEDHEFTIVEVDGIYVEKNTTDLIYITVAQRYGVLITTKNSTDKNYAFMNRVDIDMLDVIPSDLELNGTNYIEYNSDADKPEPYLLDSIDDYFDDFYLKPLSKEKLLDDADYTITLEVQMDNLGNGVNYAFFNNITYTTPKVPTLLSVLSAGDAASNELVYGTNTNSFVLQGGDVVDIVLNNLDTGKHPFHLHGHVFQLIERHEEIPDTEDPVAYNSTDHADWPEYPMLRDTVYVRPQSYIVMRFKADNPGVWFFHCHIEWHLDQGLAIQLIEDPQNIQKNSSQQITDNHKQICEKVGISWEGNAAANTKDYLDLKGENVQHKRLPTGFTARGIVALVFSCIAGVLGLATIAYYGMNDIKDVEERVARDLDVDLDEEEDEIVNDGSSSSVSNSKR
ncbi:iron transport multicopper oxidase precursor, putative [Candida dubliniensis CD36]|uniref:Iron transport multicopper oxidase, putative n=1 Tax=Candida dubliniensis (strain CD36 / ATCC MYA-646 / CBS 7987 / NCPF 3949 / NRRL Y-17841) TaxID=573826 RepID=B9WID2_CANDC|nr:iron transport multicopper oxidase precursor, putative [Candida dubliniensis CD36]CAX40996.1 iron transport multicopper oxidase precursor, putative [Candida dubliniensis CD36]